MNVVLVCQCNPSFKKTTRKKLYYKLFIAFQADVIMALAGSNGGSWSTNYGTKSNARPINENQETSGELDIGMTSNSTPAFAKEARGKLCVAGISVPLAGSVERISTTSPGRCLYI